MSWASHVCKLLLWHLDCYVSEVSEFNRHSSWLLLLFWLRLFIWIFNYLFCFSFWLLFLVIVFIWLRSFFFERRVNRLHLFLKKIGKKLYHRKSLKHFSHIFPELIKVYVKFLSWHPCEDFFVTLLLNAFKLVVYWYFNLTNAMLHALLKPLVKLIKSAI